MDEKKYNPEPLRQFASAVSIKAGMTPENAEIFVDNLICADLRGVRSHGITKFRGYLARVEHGVTDIKAEPVITRAAPAALAVDGKNGMGSTVAWKSMQACIDCARETGTAFAAVKNASHHGFGGYYVMHAAQQGMIGFEVCNTPALVAPFGGAAAFLGTNPMSVALPAGKYPALVLDMATSVVAKGKIALAIKEGREIPDNWALDADGNFTTDPVAANTGALLPFGGPKGYAIALIIDILCACLAGGLPSPEIPRVFENLEEPSGIGYFMGVIDISKFVSLDIFRSRVDIMFAALKQCPPAPGFDEVMIPGEIEHRMMEKNRKEGITISPAVLAELRELSARYEIALPEELRA